MRSTNLYLFIRIFRFIVRFGLQIGFFSLRKLIRSCSQNRRPLFLSFNLSWLSLLFLGFFNLILNTSLHLECARIRLNTIHCQLLLQRSNLSLQFKDELLHLSWRPLDVRYSLVLDRFGSSSELKCSDGLF